MHSQRNRSHGLLVFVLLAVAFFANAPVHAYIDPGSASYVFQLVIGSALGALFVIRSYWTGLKSYIGRVRSRRVRE
jgi:hydrogenase-4 membrane subunit HyfE